VDERIELFEVVVLYCPAFASPKEYIENVLQEDLMFEVQFDVLVVEEMSESAHFSAGFGDSVVDVVIG
jgi:hypothetical protein